MRLLRVAAWCTLLVAQSAAAQRFEARIGILASSTLVRDDGATGSLARALRETILAPTKLTLAPAPAASALLVAGLGRRTVAEVNGTVALSKLRASNEDQEWDTQNVSLATLTVGVRYEYRRNIWLTGGFGATHFIADSRGIFSDGSGLMPLIELGALSRIPVGSVPLHATVRVQTHTFETPALRRDGGSQGRPVRLLVQLGVGT